VFYLDSSGNTIFITAYKWDANANYIIFQSPITGKVYLRREDYTLSTLSTAGWFNPPEDPTIRITVTITWSSLFNPKTKTHTPTITSNVVTISYNGQNITLTRNKAFTWPSIPLTYTDYTYTGAYASTNTVYTGSITVSGLPSITEVKYNGLNATMYCYFSYYPTDGVVDYIYHAFATSLSGTTLYYASTSYTYQTFTPNATGTIQVATSSSTNSVTAYSLLYNVICFTVNIFLTGQSGSVLRHAVYAKTNGVITASNGNQIRVYDSLNEVALAGVIATSSIFSFYLYTQSVNVSFVVQKTISKTFVLPVSITVSNTIQNPNPAVYVEALTTWCAAKIINHGSTESFIIFTPPQFTANNLDAKIVYNYPIQYAQPNLQYIYAYGSNAVGYLAVNGSISVLEDKVVVNGSICLDHYIGSTVILNIDVADSQFTVNCDFGWINTTSTYMVVYPQTYNVTINGLTAFYSILILYNTLTEKDYAVSVGSVSLQEWSITLISYTVSGEIVGSWKYRLPIYVSLAELPQSMSETGFVFRFMVPVSDWIRSGLLSPALEDLIFTDAAGRPLPFYIYNVSNGYAIVYVRYTAPITSNTLTVYVLLQNKNLWGRGSTFSTFSTFDKVNPQDFTDDFGFKVYYSYLAYNALLITVEDNSAVKFGKTWFDFVGIDKDTVWEQHGSTVFYNQTVEEWSSNELVVYVSRQNYDDVLIYCGTTPHVALSLNEFNAGPAYYIGYKNVKFAAAYRMLMYSWSLGQIVGGYQTPPKVHKTTPAMMAPPTLDVWSLMPLLFVMVVLALVARFMQTGGVKSGGGMLSQM